MKKNYFGVILGGGQGTRFWPYSTKSKPKQFLRILAQESLISQTFERLKVLIDPKNIFIVADRKYLKLIKESIAGFSESNFIEEPVPRNTAPSLILANIFLSRLNSDANIIVVPADHYIPEYKLFADQMRAALAFADNKCIITAGIKPTMPHTGYGYIRFNRNGFSRLDRINFFEVFSFKEKPRLDLAERYIREGNYYWNSGMFIYKLKFFKKFLEKYAPYYYEKYLELEYNFENKKKFIAVFRKIKPDSIDFALMQKVKEIFMYIARFKWSDVGAWSSVYELNKKDKNGNVNICQGDKRNNILLDSKESLLFSIDNKPVALIGVDKLAVINTKNGILVANIEKLQKVKNILELLEE